MLSTQELRALVKSLDAKAFVGQLGPFALVQRPPAEAMGGANAGIPQTAMASTVNREKGVLGLIFEFDNLHVATLPPMTGDDTLTVGRLPDCDLIVDEASVSKRHASLRWHDDTRRCTLKDLGSTNGTFLNASIKIQGEVSLRDGDIISFGDVQFWYLLTETLFGKLKNAGVHLQRLTTRLMRLAPLLLLVMVACAHSSQPFPPAVTHLVVASRIVTGSAGNPQADALVWRGDRILAVGEAGVLKLRFPEAQQETLPAGAVIVPGFNDAHVHLTLARVLATTDTAKSPELLLQHLHQQAAGLPPGAWVIASTELDGSGDRATLDAQLNGHPGVVFAAGTAHLSTAGLEALGLSAMRPSGTFTGPEMSFVAEQIAHRALPKAELARTVDGFLKMARENGVTSVQIVSDDLQSEIEEGWRRRGALTVRVRLIPLGMRPDLTIDWSKAPPGPEPLRLRTEGRKFFIDSQAPMAPALLKQVLEGAQRTKTSAVIHLLGNEPLDEVLRIAGQLPDVGRWVRLEHVDVASADQAARLRQLGIAVCSNATLMREWDAPSDFPVRTLADAGVRSCLGSDWIGELLPGRVFAPLQGLAWAATHGGRGGVERLTLDAALRAMTLGAAAAEGLEHEKGTLEPGKLADWVALEADPTRSEPEQVAKIHVLRTVVGGETVFSKH